MLNTSTKITINGKQYTIRFNPDKQRFEHNYGYKDNNGVRQSRILRADSLAEMETLIIEFNKKISDNDVSNNSVTLGNYIRYYIDNIDKVKNRDSTVYIHNKVVRTIPEHILNTKLCELNDSVLQLMYNDLANRYKQNTVKYLHQLLSTILNFAVSHNVIEENVNKLCVVKGYENGEKFYLSPQEIVKFLNFLKSSKKYISLYKPCLFLAVTGVRRGECLGLKKQYLDYTNYTVKIVGQIRTANGKPLYTKKLKTKTSKRVIKLNKEIFDTIANFDENNDTEYVFTSTRGGRWDNKYFSDKLRVACKEYGIEGFSAKQFRNSFVKTAIKKNISLKIIQSILGHAKLSTTADIYGELVAEDTFDATNTICDNFNNV